jgi:hypothetical protein
MAKKKPAWLFEKEDGTWSLLRQVASTRLIEGIASIKDAEHIAELLKYRIAKIVRLKDK